MDIESRFRLVGYRFSRLLVDDAPLMPLHATDRTGMVLSTTAADPSISQLTYKSRKVIEIVVVLDVHLAEKDDGKPSAKSRDALIHATAIAGFVGVSESDDGDLELFKNEAMTNWRALYLLVRQRVQSFVSMTSLRQLNLPWEPSEITEEIEESSTKKDRSKRPPKSKVKKTQSKAASKER